MEKESKQKIILWFGDISNITALLAIAIVIRSFFPPQSKLFVLVGLGTLVLIAILKNADVGRFKDVIQSYEDIPPLGLAKGSVRALLALGFFIGLGLYLYYSSKITNYYNEKVFTALSAIISAVVGFYFGSRTTSAAQPAAGVASPIVTGIDPNKEKIGNDIEISNLAGTNFQQGATVSLVRGDEQMLAKSVNVAHSSKITCSFDLSQTTNKGKWNVVVTNPGGQAGSLPEGFLVE